ncbi:MAG: BamA/TamA family outer membrane protein [Bacteroidota bacterium]
MTFRCTAALLMGCWGLCTVLFAQPDTLTVSNISIEGNKKTFPQVILREMTFKAGDKLSFQGLEDLLFTNQQNIYNLGIFTRVEVVPEIADRTISVTVSVQERWYIFVFPHAVLEERNTYDIFQNRNLRRLSYGLTMDWANFTGRNDKLVVWGQLGFSQRFNATFSRPAIFPKPNIDLITSFDYINEKELIYGTETGIVQWGRTDQNALQRSYVGKLAFRKRFSPRKSLLLQLSYQDFTFDDSIYVFSERFVPTANGREFYPGLLLALVNDQRDIRSFPLNGFRYQVFFRQAGFPGNFTSRFAKIGATWAHHISLSEKWNFAYGFHHILTFGKELPFFEKSFIGLKNGDFPGISYNLRGYQPYAIDGSYVQMTKAEWKYALFPRQMVHADWVPFKRFQDFPFGVYLTAYTDVAYVSDQTISNFDNTFKDRWLTGFGVGLNIIGIYDNLLRLEYSWNHLQEGGFFLHGSVSIR